MDQLPDNREQNAQFKAYLLGLNATRTSAMPAFAFRPIRSPRSSHTITSCCNASTWCLGAMAFRLNDKHKEKPPGKRCRGKRTIAKERLYNHIRARICQLYPNFNIGDTTGKGGDWANLWLHPYRHWKFVPAEHEIDATKRKPKK